VAVNHALISRVVIEYSCDGSENEIILKKSVFQHILCAALRSVQVDENWYLEKYDDVREAIAKKKTACARDHYINYGYFENRQPFAIKVDEAYYLQMNPDVAAKVVAGAFKSGQEHFEQSGFREGRLPYADFSLF
jgi:hypothetical protein